MTKYCHKDKYSHFEVISLLIIRAAIRSISFTINEEKMYKVSILTVGDEICIGQIVNSNASWIASSVTTLGAEVLTHVSVRDNAAEMKQALTNLINISDFVIITGGLGPTHDDITKPVLVEYFNDELEFHNESYENVLAFLRQRKIEPTERNRQIAFLPKTCTVLRNSVGTAPGMLFNFAGKGIAALPGVPSEMKSIMTSSVLPIIAQNIKLSAQEVVLYKTLQTTGIPESILAEKIGDVNEFLNGGSLAFLPSYKGVRLRIGVSGLDFDNCRKELDRIERHIKDRAGEYIFAVTEKSLVAIVGELLAFNKMTIAVAESCTGGLLGAEFTSIAGSSEYFIGGVIAYSNAIKERILGVSPKTLDDFGAVSEETAREMAENVRLRFASDIGVSITGIAGPGGGTEEKPVGTVWIGYSDNEQTLALNYNLGNDRNTNREKAVGNALDLLYKKLKIKQ